MGAYYSRRGLSNERPLPMSKGYKFCLTIIHEMARNDTASKHHSRNSSTKTVQNVNNEVWSSSWNHNRPRPTIRIRSVQKVNRSRTYIPDIRSKWDDKKILSAIESSHQELPNRKMDWSATDDNNENSRIMERRPRQHKWIRRNDKSIRTIPQRQQQRQVRNTPSKNDERPATNNQKTWNKNHVHIQGHDNSRASLPQAGALQPPYDGPYPVLQRSTK